MSKIAIAIGAAFIATGQSLISSFSDGSAPTADASGEPAKRRDRPPRSTNAAPAAAETVAPAETPVGLSDDDLKAAIKPLVEENRAVEVKAVISKYGNSMKEIPPAKRAEFVRDIEALCL